MGLLLINYFMTQQAVGSDDLLMLHLNYTNMCFCCMQLMQNNSAAFMNQCLANATIICAAYLEDPELRRELTQGRRSWKRDRDNMDFYE